MSDDLPESTEEEQEDLGTDPPSVPEYHMDASEVEETEFHYSDRAPTDFVVSGPLGGHGRGPGRYFPSVKQAAAWARSTYGRKLLGRIDDATKFGGNRWAFLIRPTREK